MDFFSFNAFDFVNSIQDRIHFFLLSFIFWFILFLIVNRSCRFEIYFTKIKKHEADDIRNRIVSIIHGINLFYLLL